MTETLCTENPIIISPEAKSTLQERIVERKTIVYETLVDPAVIRIAAENLKDQFFTKYGFLRPTPEEVTLVTVEKTYEPFIMITGKYSIDYYRKRTCTFKVESAVSEVVFGFGRFSSKQITDSLGKTYKGLELPGEERLQSEDRTHRIGTTGTVEYRDFVAIDTRDDDVVWALQHKLDTAAMINGDPARRAGTGSDGSERQSRFQERAE